MNTPKTSRMVLKEFNYELINLRTIIDEMGKLDIIRELQFIEIDEINDEIEESKALITNLTILSAKKQYRRRNEVSKCNEKN